MNNHSNLNFKKAQLKKAQLKKAFSLIELSVVVLIIGILIAGITQSSRLVRAMKLNTARSLTRSSDVNSIRNLTAWFDATAEGVFSSSCTSANAADVDLDSVSRTFNTNTITGNPSVTTLSSAYIMPEHRQVVRLWKDSNPQDTDADKVILEYAQGGNCSTQNYSVSGTIGNNRGPMYHNSGLAGLPSIYFDGADNAWFSTINPVTMPLAAGKKEFSFFVAYRTDPDYPTSVDTGKHLIQFSKNGQIDDAEISPGIVTATNSGAESCGKSFYLSWNRANYNCNKAIYSLKQHKPSNDYALGITLDVNSLSNAQQTRTYFNSQNGVLANVGTDYTNSFPNFNMINNQFNVGGGYFRTDLSSAYKGFISEVLVFDRKLTNEEASSVMAYLIKKYNIKAL